jgi:hypothetical protein
MEEIIAKIASMIPSDGSFSITCDEPKSDSGVVFNTAEQPPSDQHEHNGDHTQNYMFFNNLESMRDMIDEILSLDRRQLDEMLSSEHDWASDHVSSAQENLQQVHSWLASEDDHDSCH